MRLLLLVAALVLQVSASSGARAQQQKVAKDAGSRPWFCRGLDCPEFEVVETSGALQLRRYTRQRFLVTRVEAASLLQAQLIGSKRLLGYLAGENEDGARLPPTVPLNSVLLTADRRGETVKGRFYFAIYLPDQVQADAPRPTNRDVRVVRLPRRAVWVGAFDEPLLTESSVIARGWALIKHLQLLGRAVDSRWFAFSEFELPLPFVPHHYEISVRARCRKAASGGGDDWAALFDAAGSAGSGNDDDDYPFPEEGGGAADDDECDDGGSPELAAVAAT